MITSKQIKVIAAGEVATDLCRANITQPFAPVGACRSNHWAVAAIAKRSTSGANPPQRNDVLARAWIELTDRS